MHQDFFYAILSQLEETMFEPLVLKCGKNPDAPVSRYILMCCTCSNDNAESYMHLGCNLRSKRKRCRVCNVSTTDMHSMQVNKYTDLRDGRYLSILTSRAEVPLMKWMLKPFNARLIHLT